MEHWRFQSSLLIVLAFFYTTTGSFAIIPQVNGATVTLTLYGSGMAGWGFTSDTMTIPGPTIAVDPGDQVSLTLVSQDRVTHNFGVDYDGSGYWDPGEPLSADFYNTTSYTFVVNATPGPYSYYCYLHRGIQFGQFWVRGNQLPKVSFTYQPPSPVAGQQVLFDASSSFDPDGRIASYAWDFGDGTNGSLVMLNHSFGSQGNFTVKITVTDDMGATASTTKNVTVGPPPVTNNPPVANFTLTPSIPRLGQRVLFDGSGSHDDDSGDRVSLYHWNFGDGVTNDTFQPLTVHRFMSEGQVTVSLTVNDSFSPQLADSFMKVVSVGPPIRDVAITKVTPLATQIIKGSMLSITAELTNKGTLEQNCDITFFQGSTILSNVTIQALPPDNLAVVSFVWNTANLQPGQYSIVVRAGIVQTDSSPQDNTASITVTITDPVVPALVAGSALALAGLAVLVMFWRRRIWPRP